MRTLVERSGCGNGKKARTKAAIQEHAARLFRERGYAATTVEQIAEAAEVSPSTFFRYFPTKEDVVLQDDYDALLLELFHAQPPELTPIQAIRSALRLAFARIPPAKMSALRERVSLILTVPELRAAALDAMNSQTVRMITGMIWERVGRDPGDRAVLTVAGALQGLLWAVVLDWADNPELDLATLLDDALALLEAGLPL